jgi:hypothetical protein
LGSRRFSTVENERATVSLIDGAIKGNLLTPAVGTTGVSRYNYKSSTDADFVKLRLRLALCEKKIRRVTSRVVAEVWIRELSCHCEERSDEAIPRRLSGYSKL